jgi:hypothetical protein
MQARRQELAERIGHAMPRDGRSLGLPAARASKSSLFRNAVNRLMAVGHFDIGFLPYTPGTPSARHRKVFKIPACYLDGVGSREYVLSLTPPPRAHLCIPRHCRKGPAFSPAMRWSHLRGRWTGALGSNGATRRFSSRCFGDLRAAIMSGLCDQDLQRRDERFRFRYNSQK